MISTKLHINFAEGVVDVEGDPALVREIYSDLKAHLLAQPAGVPKLKPPPPPRASHSTIKKKGSAKGQRKGAADDLSSGISPDAPKLDKDLDLSGLAEYFSQFEPKNHPEKILLFIDFLQNKKGIAIPNTDQIFTCYEKSGQRIPQAFGQAFWHAHGKKFGYIDYHGPTDIRLTTIGMNHLKHDMNRKKPAE